MGERGGDHLARPVNRPSLVPLRRPLAGRAALAFGLWLGFYLMGAAIVLALFWVPWAQVRYQHSVGFSGVLCVVFGLWIAFALAPRLSFKRPDRAQPLPEGAHPKLRALIDDVARSLGEKPPDELYLLADVNAFAARRGAIFGVGGRRLIGIGLPLLSALEEDEIRAVIAHEIGHHLSGDVLLGPFLHRTRMAVAVALDRLEGSSFWLHLPFALYGRVFLRLTRQVSREQELAADSVSRRVTGADAAARTLVAVERLAPRWTVYFHNEVLPLVDSGHRPPLLEGFRRFLAESELREDVTRVLKRALERGPRDHDTHPPLEERLAALGFDRVTRPPPTGSALSLLDSVERAERDALDLILIPGHPPLREVNWDDAGEIAWIAMWKRRLAAHAAVFTGSTPYDAPSLLARWEQLRPGTTRGISLLSPAAQKRSFEDLVGIWLATQLHERGFRIEAPPGAETRATNDGKVLHPEALVRKLSRGDVSPTSYGAMLGTAGV